VYWMLARTREASMGCLRGAGAGRGCVFAADRRSEKLADLTRWKEGVDLVLDDAG
jgi:hypothetical protein